MQSDDHHPVLIYTANDPHHIATPSEVCSTCSDDETGKLVPASFCDRSKAQLGPAPWEER